MSRIVTSVAVVFGCILLGFVASLAVAWTAYPEREIPEELSHEKTMRVLNESTRDAELRGEMVFNGVLVGSGVGIGTAILAHRRRNPRHAFDDQSTATV